MRRRMIFALPLALGTWVAAAFWLRPPPRQAPRRMDALPRPKGPLKTFHLGHSLVGRDMPAMLAQLAGHGYHSQLGSGASLADHWNGTVKGFAEGNAHPAHRPVREALESGDYDAVIFTEMVELKDAIRYHDSPAMLAEWASLARQARPEVRLYLYETWHRLGDPAGWLQRIDSDLRALWEDQILGPAILQAGDIRMIPAGQVMGAAARAAEAGQLPGIPDRRAFFSDDIHLNDLGNWLVAMAHYAVLYHRAPIGLPAHLTRADGMPATPPPADAVRPLQELVWRVVSGYSLAGMSKG